MGFRVLGPKYLYSKEWGLGFRGLGSLESCSRCLYIVRADQSLKVHGLFVWRAYWKV